FPATRSHPKSPLRILDWLPQVREAAQPLNDREPVWVNHGIIHEGPPMKTPERHPHYELALKLEGRGIQSSGNEQTIMRAGDALRFLEERTSEPLYARDVARAAGVTEDELKRLFHDAVGVTWVHYLQALRIRAATAFLIAGTHNVTEAALSAGFESLSHFNAT